MIRFVFFLILIPFFAFAQEVGMEVPTSPGTYRSGFFAMDARGLSNAVYQNWFNPGEEFCRATKKRNCDDTIPTSGQVSSATTVWRAMTLCNRARLRLFHTAIIKRPHTTIGEKVQLLYTTDLPSDKINGLKVCLVQNVFEYLGAKHSVVCAKLNARQAGLCAKFWPGRPPNIPAEAMDTIVSGWEADAE